MKRIPAQADSERFRSGVEQYAAYLETPEGRLRLDLAFANLRQFLPQVTQSSRVLDIGCGTGAMALRLAELGFHVTLFDSSLPMLDSAERATHEAGVTKKIVLKHGDAGQLAQFFAEHSFDVILCHNMLEYVESPSSILGAAARLLRRDVPALLSLLVRNRAGEVIKAAIQSGDLSAAEQGLTANWGCEALYGGRVQLFTPEELLALSKEAQLAIIAKYGVRVVADYLPPKISREAEYERICELERQLGQHQEFAAFARYSHYLARRAEPVMKVGA